MDTTDTPVVVCDAGPLIHLDELDILRDFQHILVLSRRPCGRWTEWSRHKCPVF